MGCILLAEFPKASPELFLSPEPGNEVLIPSADTEGVPSLCPSLFLQMDSSYHDFYRLVEK